jgi:peptidyl-prolyl cis-trans isomerase D
VTADRGGDIDVFMARGDTDPAYETALFALKPGEVSNVVGTKEGFYILRLEAVRGGEARAFESVRPEIQEELARKLAQQRFTDATKEFSDLVYDQSDSLKPVADKFKLEVLTARGVTRQADPQAKGPLSSAKFVEALFGEDTLNNKRNTEAVALKNNQLVAGRVVQHSPSVLRPLADVAALVTERLVARQSAALARKEGEARLAAARAAPAGPSTAPAQVVSRAQTQGLPREVIDAVLKAPAANLPAFVGVDLGGQGYVVARIGKVLGERDPVAADIKQGQAQYARAWGDAEEQAYLDALKARFNTKILVAGVDEKNAAAASASAPK